MISPVGGTESRHSDSDNVFTGQFQFIESSHADKQGKCRIQSSRNTDHSSLGSCMNQTLCQSGYLYGKHLFTTFVQRFPLRNKRVRIESTCQIQFFAVYEFRCDAQWLLVGRDSAFTCGKCRIDTTFST